MKKSKKGMDLIDSVIRGDTVLFAEGIAEALIISSKGFKTRSLVEPDIEKTIRGPSEGFTESLLTNLSLTLKTLLSFLYP